MSDKIMQLRKEAAKEKVTMVAAKLREMKLKETAKIIEKVSQNF